jgi:hypothetical protein
LLLLVLKSTSNFNSIFILTNKIIIISDMLAKLKGSVDIFGPRSLVDSSAQYYMFPVIELVGMYFLKQHHNPFAGLFLIYGMLPLLDELASEDWANPTEKEYE